MPRTIYFMRTLRLNGKFWDGLDFFHKSNTFCLEEEVLIDTIFRNCTDTVYQTKVLFSHKIHKKFDIKLLPKNEFLLLQLLISTLITLY